MMRDGTPPDPSQPAQHGSAIDSLHRPQRQPIVVPRHRGRQRRCRITSFHARHIRDVGERFRHDRCRPVLTFTVTTPSFTPRASSRTCLPSPTRTYVSFLATFSSWRPAHSGLPRSEDPPRAAIALMALHRQFRRVEFELIKIRPYSEGHRCRLPRPPSRRRTYSLTQLLRHGGLNPIVVNELCWSLSEARRDHQPDCQQCTRQACADQVLLRCFLRSSKSTSTVDESSRINHLRSSIR